MKLPAFHVSRFTLHALLKAQYVSRPRERGMAVICVLALVAIVLIYMAANMRTLNTLSADLKVLEKHQINRLKTATQAPRAVSVTNTPPAIQPAHE